MTSIPSGSAPVSNGLQSAAPIPAPPAAPAAATSTATAPAADVPAAVPLASKGSRNQGQSSSFKDTMSSLFGGQEKGENPTTAPTSTPGGASGSNGSGGGGSMAEEPLLPISKSSSGSST